MVRVAPTSEPARQPEYEEQETTRTPSAGEVCEAIVRVTHLLGRFANAALVKFQLPGELSVPRMRMLLEVEDAQRLRMGDLAMELCVTARTVTTMVDALEREGLIARLPDPTDRRAILLELTDAGRAHVEQMHAAMRELSDEAMAPLSSEQRRQLFDLLMRVARDGVAAETATDREYCLLERKPHPQQLSRKKNAGSPTL